MSLSPKDMDFLEAKHAAAREIALAFGVPPMLLGDPRRQHLFELPGSQPRVLAADRAAARRTASAAALTQWLAPAFGAV